MQSKALLIWPSRNLHKILPWRRPFHAAISDISRCVDLHFSDVVQRVCHCVNVSAFFFSKRNLNGSHIVSRLVRYILARLSVRRSISVIPQFMKAASLWPEYTSLLDRFYSTSVIASDQVGSAHSTIEVISLERSFFPVPFDSPMFGIIVLSALVERARWSLTIRTGFSNRSPVSISQIFQKRFRWNVTFPDRQDDSLLSSLAGNEDYLGTFGFIDRLMKATDERYSPPCLQHAWDFLDF